MSLDFALKESPTPHLLETMLGDGSAVKFEWIDRAHPERQSIEAFIADVFFQRYGAQVHYFSDVLIGYRSKEGGWVAAIGFSALAYHGAFLEQYLDQPVDRIISNRVTRANPARRVSRWDVVEVGNLAATKAGASRALILHMTRYLYRRHFQWVVLTATRELSNSFARLGYRPEVIAPADPTRLRDGAGSWGRYYDSKPQVMVVDIGASYAHISVPA